MRRSTINEEPFNYRYSREVPLSDKNKKTIGRTQDTRFNEVRQIAYVLRARRESALLIQ